MRYPALAVSGGLPPTGVARDPTSRASVRVKPLPQLKARAVRPQAEGRDVVHGVRAEEQRAALLDEAQQAVHALLLEIAVAHRQRLVDDQHVGLDLGGDREAEPHGHAGRIALHRLVDELAELAPRDDGGRSEERRGGKEGRSRWSPYH